MQLSHNLVIYFYKLLEYQPILPMETGKDYYYKVLFWTLKVTTTNTTERENFQLIAFSFF